MQVIVKTCSGISLVPLESRLLSERKIFIQGEITEETACSFEQKIIYLLTEDPDKRIDVYIDSPGGSVSAGLHIYDTIKSLHTETNMWCRGIAASMGAIILAGGQKGRRFILPHAKVMIHEPLVSGGGRRLCCLNSEDCGIYHGDKENYNRALGRRYLKEKDGDRKSDFI